MRNVALKSKKGLILPSDMPTLGKEIGVVVPNVPVKEAIRKGLMHKPYTANGRKIPASPAGAGVFAKWSIQIVDGKTKKSCYFPHPKTGRKVKKLEAPVHSFTRAFAFFIRGFLQNLDGTLNLNETVTDDTGMPFLLRLKSPVTGGYLQSISGLAKMKFGNSNAALNNSHFNLQGTLLGPVTEGTVTVALVVEDSVQTIFTVSGQITNGTGGPFTVEEMGLFAELTSNTGVLNNTTMLLRDLTGSVPVANGQTIIGTYTFTLAV